MNAFRRFDYWLSQRSTTTLRVVNFGIWCLLMWATFSISDATHGTAHVAWNVVMGVVVAIGLGLVGYDQWRQSRIRPGDERQSRPPSKVRGKLL